MHRPLFFLSALTLVFSMLVSCASVKEQVVTEPANWGAELQKRQQINSWEIRGRLGIQTENEGGTLDIIWKQDKQDYSIRLLAPLGAGNYHILGDDLSAEIRYPDGNKKRIHDINGVFRSALDVDLPADAVKDWLRGLPARGLTIESITWNEQGLLNTISQSGWNVELKQYAGNTIQMPHAIYLSRSDNTELDIRLLLRQWMLDN